MIDTDTDLKPEDEEFVQRAAERLRQRADVLDAPTHSRLNRARQAALEELERRPGTRVRPGFTWLPAGAVAGLLAAALVANVWREPAPATIPALPTAAEPVVQEPGDLEVLLTGESLELFEELDFYSWLESGLDSGLDPEELQMELDSMG